MTDYQPTLFDDVPRLVHPPASMSIEVQFLAFHAMNPWVYERLVAMTYDLKNRGHQRIGMAMLFEVLRWQAAMSTMSADDFKLNNNYRSRYARKIMADHPDLDGIYETRTLREVTRG